MANPSNLNMASNRDSSVNSPNMVNNLNNLVLLSNKDLVIESNGMCIHRITMIVWRADNNLKGI